MIPSRNINKTEESALGDLEVEISYEYTKLGTMTSQTKINSGLMVIIGQTLYIVHVVHPEAYEGFLAEFRRLVSAKEYVLDSATVEGEGGYMMHLRDSEFKVPTYLETLRQTYDLLKEIAYEQLNPDLHILFERMKADLQPFGYFDPKAKREISPYMKFVNGASKEGMPRGLDFGLDMPTDIGGDDDRGRGEDK